MAVMGYRAAVSYTPTRLPVPFDVQGDLQPYPANHLETMRLPVLSDECAAVCPHNEVYRSAAHKRGITDLVIDSTGLKVFGKGEWKVRKHGAEKGCVWRKLYLAVDLATHEVVAAEVSLENIHGAEALPTLLNTLRRIMLMLSMRAKPAIS